MGPRGICAVEGCTNLQIKNRASYGRFCDRHARSVNAAPCERTAAFKLKLDYCEKCGPEVEYHHCQLDLDHKDGNRHNDDPANRQTLCANCHRLKCYEERQGVATQFQYHAKHRNERHRRTI